MRRRDFLLAGLLSAASLGRAQGDENVGEEDGFSLDDITPAFSLVDHHGTAVTLADYRGAWKLLYFGYSNCIDACPLALSAIDQTVELLKGELPTTALYVDFDAGPDRLAVLASFVGDHFSNVVGLTGDRRQIQEAGRNFKLRRVRRRPAPGEIGDQYHHSSRLYLLAPDDRVLAFMHDDSAPEAIAQTIREFAAVTSEAAGG